MHRTQISLEPEQYRKLGAEARRLGISLSALIRRLVDAHRGGAQGQEEEEDPLDAIAGIGRGDGAPVGREHNRYLYGDRER